MFFGLNKFRLLAQQEILVCSSVVENFDVPNLNLGAVTITDDSYDNSGVADPGETVTLNIPLNNPFCLTGATGVTMDVTGGGSANYGDIAAPSVL